MKNSLKILIFSILLSSCSCGRYAEYYYNSYNMRLNREKPRVHKSYPKSKMKKNIKNNNTYIRR